MTSAPDEGNSTPSVPGIEYDGPADLAGRWNIFARLYSRDGASGAKPLNLLNQLAFRGATSFLKEHGKPPSKVNRRLVDAAAQKLSDLSAESDHRPMHKAVIRSLIEQWIELERAHGLYPPTSILRMSREMRADIYAKRVALLQSPEGSLVSGTLKMICAGSVEAWTKALCNRNKRVGFDDVLSLAYDQFNECLFSFQEGRGTEFLSYLGNGLNSYLPARVRRAPSSGKELQMTDGDESSFNDSRDERAPRPVDVAINAERQAMILGHVDKLKPKLAYVVKMRFGPEDGKEHTLDELGRELGISKERVRQIEESALSELATMQYEVPPNLSTPAPEPWQTRRQPRHFRACKDPAINEAREILDNISVERATPLIDALPDREREVIRYRYGFEDNQTHRPSETAARLGISGTMVYNLERQGLENFRTRYLDSISSRSEAPAVPRTPDR